MKANTTLPGADWASYWNLLAAASVSAMFEGFEAARKAQEQATRLRFDIEGATRYWQQAAASALEVQARMLGAFAPMADSAAVLEAAHAFDACTGLRN